MSVQLLQLEKDAQITKEALIGRAAADINRPGSLPCPDVNDDGIAELTQELASRR